MAVMAISVLACGDSETASTTAGNAPEAAAVAPDSAPGSASKRAELPDGFPSDIPSVPGAVLTESRVTDALMLATFETPDDPATVVERLKRDFIANGWQAEVSIRDAFHSIDAEKQGREVIVTLNASGGTTIVDFFVSEGG
ncbi:MAG: hypothetical protein V3T01_12395 [Myxococcota bacterium]